MLTRTNVLLFLYLALAAFAAASDKDTCLVGIDHIPVAVRDLDGAAENYRQLGFAIKPGRPHANGIQNKHVKFEDGTGIELITAPRATDSLTETYVRLLERGEGPAFLSFHTADLAEVKARLAKAGYRYTEDGGLLEISDPRLDYIFIFEGDNRSPTDRPEHFQHANSAQASVGVWIADGDDSALLHLLRALGAAIRKTKVHVPEETQATVAAVANGEVIFLPASRRLIHGRRIIGAVFKTRDLAAVRTSLSASNIPISREIKTKSYESLFVAPQQTNGLWLEFRHAK